MFDHFLASSGLHGELTSWESEAFKARFTKEMVWQLSSDEDAGSAYVNVAKEALESQKPVMTEALAKSLNKAGLGFRVEMRAWLVQELCPPCWHCFGLSAGVRLYSLPLRAPRPSSLRPILHSSAP